MKMAAVWLRGANSITPGPKSPAESMLEICSMSSQQWMMNEMCKSSWVLTTISLKTLHYTGMPVDTCFSGVGVSCPPLASPLLDIYFT